MNTTLRTPLLTPVGRIKLPAMNSPFIASEKFVCNMDLDATVRIRYIDPRFQQLVKGIVIGPRLERFVFSNRLENIAVDALIMEELAIGASIDFDLSALYELMVLQRDGENGILTTSATKANRFYLLTDEGWVVISLQYRQHAWSIVCEDLADSERFAPYTGTLVFSIC